MQKGKASFRSSNNLLVIEWVDKKKGYMLSTMHTVEFATVFRHREKKVFQKPVCVVDYTFSGVTPTKRIAITKGLKNVLILFVYKYILYFSICWNYK